MSVDDDMRMAADLANIKTGGSAFKTGYGASIDRETVIPLGVTVLDYFAAKAMEKVEFGDSITPDPESLMSAAEQCYTIAEAMLAEKRARE